MIRFLTVCMAALALFATLMVAPASAAELTVSAAMSLKTALEEIGKRHTALHPEVTVRFNFGASGDLARQIAGGAAIDIFASAAQKDMDDLAAKGLIVPSTRANFTRNTLVLVTPTQGVRLNAFADLASPAVKRIAITNSKTSPAGRYALEALAYYRIADATKSKLILAENVRQVMDYIVRGEVDAGIVFASDATTRSRDSVIAATASPASHDSILYPVAIIKGSAQSQAAVAFITTLLSPDGQMILIKHGLAGMK